MLQWTGNQRDRVDSYKIAITKSIYECLDEDQDDDAIIMVAALAELTATYGARLLGRDITAEMLDELKKQVIEHELEWVVE
jgi:hypothetical protein